jgi:hypothetical protein
LSLPWIGLIRCVDIIDQFAEEEFASGSCKNFRYSA